MATLDSLFCPCLTPVQQENFELLFEDLSASQHSAYPSSFFQLDPLRKYELYDRRILFQWLEKNGYRTEFQIGAGTPLGWARIIESPAQPNVLKLNLFFATSRNANLGWELLQKDIIDNNKIFKISVECLESDQILLNSLLSLDFSKEGELHQYHYMNGLYDPLVFLARFYHE